MKTCLRCSVSKDFGEFGKYSASKDGLRPRCKKCENTAAAEWRQANPEAFHASQLRYRESHRTERCARARAWNKANPQRKRENFLRSTRVCGWMKHLATRAKLAAKRRGWSFDLDATYIESLYVAQGGRCHWLGIELCPAVESRGLQRPSLDRLDISLGYVRGNVVLACQFANMGRNTVGAERFREFIEATGLNHNIARPDAVESERYVYGTLL